MTRRIQVTLDGPDTGKVSIVPQVIQHVETDDISVKKWSESAIERMFEAAENALKEPAEN